MSRPISILLVCVACAAWILILHRQKNPAVPQGPGFAPRRVNIRQRVRPPVEEPAPAPILEQPVEDVAPVSDGGKAEKVKGPLAGADLFPSPAVPRIRIEIPPPGMVTLGRTPPGPGQDRPTVRATIKEGGQVFTNVAIHLKGAAGSFRPLNDNPCFTLNFDKFAAGQNFHGLTKLSLNNSVQDPSYLSEQICRELFEAAGVPVPRAAHAKVTLNGRNLGLYVLTEGFGKQFLKRYFKNAKGNLYDGGFVRDITQPLSLNSGDNPEDHRRLRELATAAREPDSTQRFAKLDQVLDMDRFLSFLAMDVMQCNWDGYAVNRNNWRLFHDLGSNKMIFFPHGLDQMFGVARADPEFPIFPRMQGLVAQRVISTPEGRRRYLERMGQLYTNVFHVDALLKRVDELAAVIRPVIAESNSHGARWHDEEVKRLKQRIYQRGESLKRQLAMAASTPKMAANGSLRLTGWNRRAMSGAPAFREQTGPDGSAALGITASSANTVASWRTRVELEEGQYRFQGKIRTRDVKPGTGDARAGAELRISGGPVPQGISGSGEWRSFSYPFRVTEGRTDVELVCELRASKGEAWFDAASLQVVRVP